jgi:hypothetical protein
MIIDTVDDVAECKYLKCPPFPIDYRRTLNQVPVMDELSAPVHFARRFAKLKTSSDITTPKCRVKARGLVKIKQYTLV